MMISDDVSWNLDGCMKFRIFMGTHTGLFGAGGYKKISYELNMKCPKFRKI